MQTTQMSFPMTRQGVRDLDHVETNILPVSGGRVSEAPDAVNVGPAERMLSSIGGGTLTVLGLRCGTTLGLGLALVGVALVFRGMTGHCDLYQAAGINTANPDSTREFVYQAR